MNTLAILFLCTGNSCRSQMAEGWAKKLFSESPLAESFQVRIYSAGVEAHGVNSRAVEVMAEAGVDISEQTSKLVTPEMLGDVDWVITLCSHAEGNCPALPTRVKRRHWDLPDPAKATGGDADLLTHFRDSRDTVKRAIEEFIPELESRYLGAPVPQFSGADVDILKRETLYQGFFEMQELTLRHKLFEGGWSDAFKRELFVRGLAVVALLYDPERDKVVLVEQFRVGSIEDSRSPWLLELVAGIVDDGQSPEEVVRREAMEEAGCEVAEVTKLYEYWVSPGANSERVAIYYGRVDTSGLGGVHGLEHENEDIRVEVVDAGWAFAAINSGIINNAATILALQWLQLNRNRLRNRG